MALTLPHPLARLPLSHRTPRMAPPLHRAPTSVTGIGSLRFSAIRFPAKPIDQVALKTSSDSKTQYGPVLIRATASGSQTAESEGTPLSPYQFAKAKNLFEFVCLCFVLLRIFGPLFVFSWEIKL